MKRLLTPIVLALAFAACEEAPILGPEPPSSSEERAGSPALGVMTYNVYVGARLENLLLIEDPSQIPFAALQAVSDVEATNFYERAEAIVDQIEEQRPHLIGLQEVSTFRIQSPGDFLIGNPVQATTPVLVFLDILEDALQARGLHYTVEAQSENFNVELPIVNPETGGLDDIRYTEYGVILVRHDVAVTNSADGTFAAYLPIELGGQLIKKHSGWTSVDVDFKGLSYRFVNTHLEPADAGGVLIPELAPIQAGQIAELLGIVDQSPLPVIMVGDFNSNADGATTETYQDVLDAGFVDTWLVGNPRGVGYTANQEPDLLNAESQLFHRIDFVFYRDEFTRGAGHFQGAVMAELVGEEQDDRTSPKGMWPSDHAGVSARLFLAPAVSVSY